MWIALISLLQTAPAPGGAAGGLVQFLPMIFIFVIFYFLLIAPMRKKQKKAQEMLSQAQEGRRGHHGRRHLRPDHRARRRAGLRDPADLRQHQDQGLRSAIAGLGGRTRSNYKHDSDLEGRGRGGDVPSLARPRRAAARSPASTRRLLPVHCAVLFFRGGGSWARSFAGASS